MKKQVFSLLFETKIENALDIVVEKLYTRIS